MTALMGITAEGFKNKMDNANVEAEEDILSLVSPEHLERLIQICSEDGLAVLEYEDTGLVLIAEKDGENFIIWQVKKEGQSSIQTDNSQNNMV